MDATDIPSTESCGEKACRGPKCCWIWGVVAAVVIVGFLLAEFSGRRERENVIIGLPTLKADAKQLKATLISPHLEAPIRPGKNVLWCSTFQLVWNEGCRYAGGDIHLQNEPPIVAVLNKKAASEKDVDADSCLVMSGLVEKGIVGKIRQQLDRKFQGQADPDLLKSIEPNLPPQGWLGYAYLFRELPFEYPFKRLEEPLSFGSARVASFGLREVTSRMDDIHKAQQVVISDYKGADDFVLQLKPMDKSERIVLAKIPPAATLLKTIETVRSRIAPSKIEASEQSLETDESLVVPILNFDLRHAYDELCGKPVTTPGPLKGAPIVLALQSIRFRLDERGAIVKSEAAMAACLPGDKPRQFIFDKPFLILLERRGAAQPYFALWVDNPELLTPFR